MTTAKSSFSMGRLLPVYRNTLRRFWGTGIFFTVLGFLFLPLQYILTMMGRSPDELTEGFVRNLSGAAECYNFIAAFCFFPLAIITPIVLACNLFGFMHNKRAVDVYHALPVTRIELFFAHAGAGLTLLWLPLALNFGVTALAAAAFGRPTSIAIFVELLWWLVVTLVIFAITAFASVQVGSVFDTAAFSLVLNGSLVAIYGIFITMAQAFLFGFSTSGDLAVTLARLSPVSLLILRNAYWGEPEIFVANNLWMLGWAVAGLVLLGVAAWLYGRRRSEQAEQLGNLGPLQIFVRAVGTLVAGCLFGLMLCAALEIYPEQERVGTLVCFYIGSLLAYVIGDVILSRSLKHLKKAVVPALCTALAVCLYIGGVMFDLTGYEKRIPATESVKSVGFSDSYMGWNTEITLESPEAIELVRALHQQQIDNKDSASEWGGYGWLNLDYRLKTGGHFERAYYNTYRGSLEPLAGLQVNDEYLQKAHPVFAYTADDLRMVRVQNVLGDRVEMLTLGLDQRRQLVEALQADLLEQDAADLLAGEQGIALLRMGYYQQPETTPFSRYDSITYTSSSQLYETELVITEKFTRTRAFLEGQGKGALLQNDWSTVKIAYLDGDSFDPSDYRAFMANSPTQDLENMSERILNRGEGDYFAPLELTTAQLNALRGKLFCWRMLPADQQIFVVPVIAGDGDQLTGCFYIAREDLPAEIAAAYDALQAETQAAVEAYYDIL